MLLDYRPKVGSIRLNSPDPILDTSFKKISSESLRFLNITGSFPVLDENIIKETVKEYIFTIVNTNLNTY